MGSLTIDHGKVGIRVVATAAPTLPPVRLVIRTGVAYLQAYLTPTEALAFASMLIELAATAEEVDA